MTTLTINGAERTLDVDPDTPLLWVLRDELRLTGTKFGCGVAQCGACTVMLNGMPRRACVTPIRTLAGADVTTIEGMSGREYDAVQAAWRALDVPQCGWCQSGQVMSATMLLQQLPAPNDQQNALFLHHRFFPWLCWRMRGDLEDRGPRGKEGRPSRTITGAFRQAPCASS